MPIQTSCGGCQKQYKLAEKYAGKTIKCPACQTAISVPNGDSPPVASELKVSCENCHHTMRLASKYAGKRIKCPKCTHVVSVPGNGRPTMAPPIAAAPPPQVLPPGAAPPPIVAMPAAAPPSEPPPIVIDTGSSPAASNAAVASPASDYQPVLRSTGQSMSMAYMSVGSELKKTKRNNKITSSMVYQVGESRSFWERVKAGTHIGPFVKKSEVHVDQLHLMKISDPAGEFHMIIPYDNGSFCPIEYLSIQRGQLPASLGLLRGKGGNWGIETSNSAAGVFLPQYMRSAMTALGGQAESVWVLLEEGQPQAVAEIANGVTGLRQGLRFDAKLNMGHVEITYHIDWIAQAIPLDQERYLLAAQFIPERKMLGVGLGAAWFVSWRQQFVAMASQLPPGNGRRQCFDYGNWGTVAQEILGLQLA